MAGVETAADFGAEPTGSAERWKAEIRAFTKETESWVKRVEGINKRYRDERERADEARRFAMLWANIEVLSPTLYARDPKPEVSRRFKDRDPVGKVAGQVIERNLSVAIDDGSGAFGRVMKAAVKDFLLGGQGTAWVRYEVELGLEEADDDGGLAEVDSPAQEAAEGDEGASQLVASGAPGAMPDGSSGRPGAPPQPVATNERAVCDYVSWRDFGRTAGARTWDEVSAVWRKSYLTRDALKQRFGDDVGGRVPLDCKRDGDDANDKDAEVYAKATVFEIWDASDRSVHWVHTGMDTELDAKPYPLKIRGKFPCPAPLFSTLTTGSLVPVPDFVQYQDQATELDELTGRIAALTSALRVAGFVPGDAAADVQTLLQFPGEGRLMPVKGWSMWGQAGGSGKLADTIVWLPIDVIVKVLAELLQIRERVKQDAYEITGLSDILRGSTQATETATAQSLKAQWGSIRVRTRQQDVQRFAAECLNLMAEVMVGHFDVERLFASANVQALPPADLQYLPAVAQLLQAGDPLLHYRVDVETDSTVEADEAAGKAAWTEMLQGVSAFLAAMAPILEGVGKNAPMALPAVTSMVGELLTGAVRQLRAGPAVEAAVEMAFEALGQAAATPPPPPAPNPVELAKQQVDAGKVQVAGSKVQVDAAKVQAERERTAADAAQAQDESAHRTADRHLAVLQMVHQAATAAPPSMGVV